MQNKRHRLLVKQTSCGLPDHVSDRNNNIYITIKTLILSSCQQWWLRYCWQSHSMFLSMLILS